MILFKGFGCFFKLCSVMPIAVNGLNTKHSQILRLINLKEILIFDEFQALLK